MSQPLRPYPGTTEGPLGFPQTDRQARALDAILKALPKDEAFHYRKTTLSRGPSEVLPGERADVSWITTEHPDRTREVVCARGMDDSQFKLNPLVTLQHAYTLPPVGRSLWRKVVRDGAMAGVKAKTQYPVKPDGWEGTWPADVALSLVQADLLRGKSIGFLPTKIHSPSEAERQTQGWQDVDLVIEEWILLEYACTFLHAWHIMYIARNRALARVEEAAMAAVTAYSYIRFSTKMQAKGDSKRRQTDPLQAEAYCKRRGWTLSPKTYEDLGVSAWRGKNALVGNLAEFLKAVESGAVKRGSALIVESLDRISRQGIDEGYETVKRILKAGILLVTLAPEREFDLSATKSLSRGAMEIMLILERAAEESERKSERIKAAWAGKRIKAREKGAIVTSTLPAWIERHADKSLHLVPERAKAVRRIFALAAAGYGRSRIVQTLRAEGIPSFSGKGEWPSSTIGFILTDRRALGFYQPKKLLNGDSNSRVPDGDPLPSYYPAAVTEQEWLAARAGMVQRWQSVHGPGRKWTAAEDAVVRDLNLSVGTVARRLDRTRAAVYQRRLHLGLTAKQHREGKGNFVNIFTGLIRNAQPPHDSFIVVQRMDAGGPTRALLNAGHAEGKAPCSLFPLEPFERAVLHWLREIDPKDILPPKEDAAPDPVAELQTELAGINAELAEVAAFMEKHGFSPTIGKRVATLETRRGQVEAKLLDERAKAAHPGSAAWQECGSLLDILAKAPDRLDARLRLRVALRRVVEKILLRVVPVPGKRERIAFVLMYLRDSRVVRSYAMVSCPPIGNQHRMQPARSWSLCLDLAADEVESVPGDKPPERPAQLAETIKKIAEAGERGEKIEFEPGKKKANKTRKSK